MRFCSHPPRGCSSSKARWNLKCSWRQTTPFSRAGALDPQLFLPLFLKCLKSIAYHSTAISQSGMYVTRGIVLKMKWGDEVGGRGVVIRKKCVDAIRSEWTSDVCKVTNVYMKYKKWIFVGLQRSVWTPPTFVHARLRHWWEDSRHFMGGDLGAWGTVPPKFEVGDGPCIRQANILRSRVVGWVRK